MSDPALIASGLLSRAATLSVGSPALPISYPDVAFTPPADGKYLEVSIFYNRPAWEGLAAGRMDQGLLQVTVVGPKGQGIPALMRLASDVIDHFPKGLSLTGGVKISRQPYAASPLLDDADTRVPVTIGWTAR